MKLTRAFLGSEFSGRVFSISRFSSSHSRVTPKRGAFSVLNTHKTTGQSTAGFTQHLECPALRARFGSSLPRTNPRLVRGLSQGLTVCGQGAGFTLIELLLVISIISLLSSVVFASANSARVRARDAKRIAEISQINRALTVYFNVNNYSYPGIPPICGSVAWVRSDQAACWTDFTAIINPYLSATPVDPLNRTIGNNSYVYVYQPVNGNAGYRLGANLENVSGTAKGDGCWAKGGKPTGFPDAFYCMGDNWQ